MKIISYNIAKCTQNKIDLVLCMGADLYILPECAEHKRIVLPKGYTMLWAGDEEYAPKRTWSYLESTLICPCRQRV